MFASQGVPVAFLIIGLMMVPESPRWLAAKGYTERALAVLKRINGIDRAKQELEEIIARHVCEFSRQGPRKCCVRTAASRWR